MGCGLWDHLRDVYDSVLDVENDVRRIFIDITGIAYKLTFETPLDVAVKAVFFGNFLVGKNYEPVFVIDNCRVSQFKRDTYLKRRSIRYLTQQHRQVLYQALVSNGFRVIVSPYESDPVVVALAISEGGDILSMDSDILLYVGAFLAHEDMPQPIRFINFRSFRKDSTTNLDECN